MERWRAYVDLRRNTVSQYRWCVFIVGEVLPEKVRICRCVIFFALPPLWNSLIRDGAIILKSEFVGEGEINPPCETSTASAMAYRELPLRFNPATAADIVPINYTILCMVRAPDDPHITVFVVLGVERESTFEFRLVQAIKTALITDGSMVRRVVTKALLDMSGCYRSTVGVNLSCCPSRCCTGSAWLVDWTGRCSRLWIEGFCGRY